MDALEILLKKQITIVLLDLSMPLINGAEFINVMRSINIIKHTPVIAMSNYYLDEIPELKFNDFSFTFLLKPVKRNLLISTLNIILEGKKIPKIKCQPIL